VTLGPAATLLLESYFRVHRSRSYGCAGEQHDDSALRLADDPRPAATLC